jgi:membrane protein
MNPRMQTGITYGKNLWREIKEDDLQGKAAEIAYHLLFSIIPLLIFLTALSSFISQQIGVDDAMDDITKWVRDQLPRESQAAVIGPIENTLETTAGGLLSFGAITALWGGKNALGAVIKALNTVFEVEEDRPWLKQQAIAIGLTILLGLAAIAGSATLLLSSTVGSDIADRLGLGNFWTSTWRWLQIPVIAAILVMVVATVFWRGPNINHSFRSMLPGAIATVVLWAIAVFALSIYFASFAGYLGGAYGALGGVMAFVFFLYVMSLITLVGGQISAFAASRTGPQPTDATRRSTEAGGSPRRATPRKSATA